VFPVVDDSPDEIESPADPAGPAEDGNDGA